LIESKMKIKISFQGVRVDSINKFSKELIYKLKKVGCYNLYVGLESGSEKLLKLINKKQTPRDVVLANKKLSKSGIYVRYNVLLGLPGETKKDLRQTINLLLGLLKDKKDISFILHIFLPYPKTKIAEIVKEYELDSKKNLEDWINYENDLFKKFTIMHSEKRYKILRKIYYLFFFVDNKLFKWDFNLPLWLKIYSIFYRPIAIFRVKNLFFTFMPEFWLYDYFIKKNKANIHIG